MITAKFSIYTSGLQYSGPLQYVYSCISGVKGVQVEEIYDLQKPIEG